MLSSLKKPKIVGVYDSPKIRTTNIKFRKTDQKTENIGESRKNRYFSPVSSSSLGKISHLSTASNLNCTSLNKKKGAIAPLTKEILYEENQNECDSTNYISPGTGKRDFSDKKHNRKIKIGNLEKCIDLFNQIKTNIKNKLQCSTEKTKLESQNLQTNIERLNGHLRSFSDQFCKINENKYNLFSNTHKTKVIAYRVKKENSHLKDEIIDLKKETEEITLNINQLNEESKYIVKQYTIINEELGSIKVKCSNISKEIKQMIKEKKCLMSSLTSITNKTERKFEELNKCLNKESLMKSQFKLLINYYSENMNNKM